MIDIIRSVRTLAVGLGDFMNHFLQAESLESDLLSTLLSSWKLAEEGQIVSGTVISDNFSTSYMDRFQSIRVDKSNQCEAQKHITVTT